jgi:hypothetical protein
MSSRWRSIWSDANTLTGMWFASEIVAVVGTEEEPTHGVPELSAGACCRLSLVGWESGVGDDPLFCV